MANENYQAAYETAAAELESLLQEQSKIESRILALRKSMNALAVLISQHGGKDKHFLDYANARLRDLVDTSLTEDIKRIMAASTTALTTSDVRDELNKLGSSLVEHSNPLATINAILNRLEEQNYVGETVKEGRKAWRWKRLTLKERIQQTGRSIRLADQITAERTTESKKSKAFYGEK